MARIGIAAAPCVLGLLVACVPVGGPGFQTGQGSGGGGSPTATAQEISTFLSNASALISHYDQGLVALECGYFGSDGSYESFVFEAYPDGTYYEDSYDEFYGGWSVRGSQLCINGRSDYGWMGIGCTTAEWSMDDTMLLIDDRDEVVAEIFAYDGPGEYWDNECGL